MRLLPMLAVTALLSACGAAISDRPACRVTEFPRDLQMQAAEELRTAPALRTMMDAMAQDRAANRAICP